MEFEFLILEDVRLRVHISQRSNLKYMKIVVDHFDERQHEDFSNSSLGYLAEVLDIQFSAQLIQQLVFKSVHAEKVNELWFNVQGHLIDSVYKSSGVASQENSKRPRGGRRMRLLTQFMTSPLPYRIILAPQFNSSHAGSGVGGQSGRQDSDNRVSSGRSESIAALVALFAPTTASGAMGANVEASVLGSLPQEVHGRGTEPCPDKHDMAVGIGRSLLLDEAYSVPCSDEEELPVETEHLQDGVNIGPCSDDDHEPLPTPIDDPQDGAATELSHAVGVNNAKLDSCNMMDGEGKFIACITSAYDTYA
ncbi:Hypothetical predicted protein [Olea europaea subsp. europaea]|uniref:Uncharacterized protein n=1 Tax=Olea europaea subsp. europaea TaxID=158383 RepID=A0A8S0SV16_OLEEU|nr:Hypothetical predicted protein [Olea europaea subsp. europaea]